MKLGIISFWY